MLCMRVICLLMLLAGCAGRQVSAVHDATLPAPRIYFSFDESQLDAAAQQAIRDDAAWLEAQSSQVVLLEGHTDSIGSAAYNEALGDRRARSAAEGLIEAGVAPERIAGVVSYGESEGLHRDFIGETGASDRRVEMSVW